MTGTVVQAAVFPVAGDVTAAHAERTGVYIDSAAAVVVSRTVNTIRRNLAISQIQRTGFDVDAAAKIGSIHSNNAAAHIDRAGVQIDAAALITGTVNNICFITGDI